MRGTCIKMNYNNFTLRPTRTRNEAWIQSFVQNSRKTGSDTYEMFGIVLRCEDIFRSNCFATLKTCADLLIRGRKWYGIQQLAEMKKW